MLLRLQVVTHWWITKLRGLWPAIKKKKKERKWKINNILYFVRLSKCSYTNLFVSVIYIHVCIGLCYICLLLSVVVREVWRPMFYRMEGSLGLTEFSLGLEMFTDCNMGWGSVFWCLAGGLFPVLFCSFIGWQGEIGKLVFLARHGGILQDTVEAGMNEIWFLSSRKDSLLG